VVAVSDCSGVSGCWPMREMKTPLVPLMVLKGRGGDSKSDVFLFWWFLRAFRL
jgi:hypothetical protein